MPEQNIHNHIMLAYELIRGYTRKNGTPRCMMQSNLQKAYDMVDCRAINNINVKYRHPIPRLDDMLDELHGANIFPKMILKVVITK